MISWRLVRPRKLLHDARGSVLVIFAVSLIPMLLAIGMVIDYSRAMRLQTKLSAAADAAALATVSRQGMSWTTPNARSSATEFFKVQARALEPRGLVINYNDMSQFSVVVSDDSSDGLKRTTTITFRAQSKNIFANLLGVKTLTVRGGAGSTSSLAPNIDLYVMLDTSPSMLLPVTSEGVASMVAATGGCAFACHETSNPNNNLQIARSRNIVLRTDVVSSAVKQLAVLAKTVGQSNNATYRMGIQSFDHIYRTIWPISSDQDGSWVDQDLDRVRGHVADAKVLSYCRNSERTCGIPDMDTASDQTAALMGINATIPNPGKGSSRPGDRPQAILFIITDGMRDEYVPSERRRAMGPMPTELCSAIKARNIRIAMLNTKYLPESASDDWSIENVRIPFLAPEDRITPALLECASPGLYHQVTVDEDLSGALSKLFQKAVTTARLIS